MGSTALSSDSGGHCLKIRFLKAVIHQDQSLASRELIQLLTQDTMVLQFYADGSPPLIFDFPTL